MSRRLFFFIFENNEFVQITLHRHTSSMCTFMYICYKGLWKITFLIPYFIQNRSACFTHFYNEPVKCSASSINVSLTDKWCAKSFSWSLLLLFFLLLFTFFFFVWFFVYHLIQICQYDQLNNPNEKKKSHERKFSISYYIYHTGKKGW